ncbi:MAG TPA: sporulation protein YqfD [Syntrophomonadaceae bacterium]|nr:sporulation protein YqfD [Syntrophomonadaceae bacterium]
MSNKFFDQVSGIIKVKLNGKKQEKVINMALARGIYIWGIKRTDNNIQFKIRNNSLEALKHIADESGNEIEIVSEEGLPFFKNVFKRRIGFFSGALIFVLTLYFISSFLWFVEVSGNEKIETKKIMLIAAKHGVYQGAAKWNFSCNDVEEAILRDLSDLTYVKVGIKGVKAKIEVVEKVLAKKEITGPCHMVASKNGVVEQVLILEGQANTIQGDVVAKGDILISGLIFPEENMYFTKPEAEETEETEETEKTEPYYVRARGEVKAVVWYEGYGECKLKSEEITLTQNKQTRIFLKTPWKTFMVKGKNSNDFDLAEQKIDTKVWNTPIGKFGLNKEIMQEKVINIKKYTEKEATKIAQDKATQIAQEKLMGAQKVINTKVEVLSAPSDPILRVKVSIEAIENIAIPEPINVVD